VTAAGKSPEKAGAGKETAGKGRLAITLVRSGICAPKDQKATLTGLGFGRLGTRVVREDSPALRGMIRKVRHLVEVTKG
jgi:large subunit ribosomal protein L30